MAGREVTAPLLANEDPRDSFDEDERALLQQEETKQIRRVRDHPVHKEGKMLRLCYHLFLPLNLNRWIG